MNERIRELVEQAQYYANEQNDKHGVSWIRTYNEKFAELIVRECVTIINHGIDHTDYPHPNDTEKSMIEMKAQMWCRDAIKEHFGVK
jgi:hypothetical protein